jgi:hypothetical protein
MSRRQEAVDHAARKDSRPLFFFSPFLLSYSGVAVGNQKLVQADQLSGRVVAVSNAAVFKDPVFNDTQRALICYMR